MRAILTDVTEVTDHDHHVNPCEPSVILAELTRVFAVKEVQTEHSMLESCSHRSRFWLHWLNLLKNEFKKIGPLLRSLEDSALNLQDWE